MSTTPHACPEATGVARRWAVAELLAMVGLILAVAGGVPPSVNEAHYLAKARHYWDPTWCQGDAFLESADAHLVFYWTIGWLTLWLPLPAVAWTGRLATWGLLAWSWRRLSLRILPGPWWALLTLGLYAGFLSCGHMAGEWVFGGLEAKGIAYVLLFLALEALWQGRWNRAWLLLGAASSFHVLTGGWSVIAAFFVWICSPRERPRLATMLPSLAGGFALALPGLLPALALTWQVDQALVAEANELYVHRRLSHHLVFHKILLQPLAIDCPYLGLPRILLPATHLYFLRHLLLVAGWAGLCCKLRWGNARRVHLFVGGALLIAVGGIVIDQATLSRPDLSAGLLRFYWFRLSDALVPAGLALACGRQLLTLPTAESRRRWLAVSAVFVSLVVGDAVLRRALDPRPDAVIQAGQVAFERERDFTDWLAACRWIRAHTARDEIVLTPRGQQTFKWYAERAEVVNWKDIPQDAAGIIDWWRRHQQVYPAEVRADGLTRHDTATLRRLAAEFQFRYVIIDRAKSLRPPPLPRVFPEARSAPCRYEIYRVDSESAE